MPIAIPPGPTEIPVTCLADDHPGDRWYCMPTVDIAVEYHDTPEGGASIHWFCPVCRAHNTKEIDEDALLDLMLTGATFIGETVTMVLPGCTLDQWLERSSADSSVV